MVEHSKFWHLKNIKLFHGMQRTVMREVRRREVLYLPGDADRIYLLKRGVVQINFRRRGLVVLESRAFRLPRPQALQELQ